MVPASGDVSSPVAGSGPSGGSSEGGGSASGGSGLAGNAGEASCDDIPCPDLGTCTAEKQPAGCLRRCSFSTTYPLASNDAAARLAALQCTVIEGSISCGGSVDDLGGLGTIREITGGLSVLSASALNDFDGFSSLETLHDLVIQNVNVASVRLPALKEVEGHVDLEVLSSLTSVELPSLATIGAYLTVTVCPLLPELRLDKLESVGQALNVSADGALTTVHAFPALLSVGQLQFTSDPKLPQCEVDALATRLGVKCMCSGNDTQATCN